MKRGRLQKAGVKLRRFVDMENIVRQFLKGGEVGGTDEAFRVKIFLHPGITPMDWDGVDMEGIDQLFRGPSGAVAIFKSNVEAIVFDPADLVFIAVHASSAFGNAEACVVQRGACGIHFAFLVEDMKKVLPLTRGMVRIGAKKGAEMGLGRTDGDWVWNR